MAKINFTDADLLDALEEGLVLFAHDILTEVGWERTWFCIYDSLTNSHTHGPTARDAIRAALLEKVSCSGSTQLH